MAKKKKTASKSAKTKTLPAGPAPTLKRITPVLFVDSVEKCVPFWTLLGFKTAVSVPHGKHTGFVILVKDDTEVMYQSRASVAKDLPALAKMPSSITLYVEVEKLDTVEHTIGNSLDPVVPRRTTFYGAQEIGFREPGGNVVIFAEPKR